MRKELYIIYKSFLKDDTKDHVVGIVDTIDKAKKYCDEKNENVIDEKYYYDKFYVNKLDESNIEVTISEYDHWSSNKEIRIEKKFTDDVISKNINVNVLGYPQMRIVTDKLKENEYYLNLFKIVNEKINEGLPIEKINALFL